MGYNLAIGEAMFEGSKEEAYLRVWASPQAHDDAPVFPNDGLSQNSNYRSPSYTGWAEFCRDVGLYAMFYGVDGRRDPYMRSDPDCYREEPILADHPGYAAISDEDALAVRQALERHVAKHGDLVPGFRPWDKRDQDAPANALICAQRARLLWLDYWVGWAVRTCAHPIIANS